MSLGQGRHHLGMASDKRRIDTRVLDELANQLVQHASISQRWRAHYLHLLQHLLEKSARFWTVKLVPGRELFTTSLFQSRDHINPLPRTLPIDREDPSALTVERGYITSCDMLDHAGDQVLGHSHQVIVVRVSLVELTGRELRTVSQIKAFVTELLADLVDSWHGQQ